MKFTVMEAANGWIVQVRDYGKTILKEPYNTGSSHLWIFKDWAELTKWIESQGRE